MVPFLPDTGAQSSTIKADMKFPQGTETITLAGFSNLPEIYPLTIPLLVKSADTTVHHQFVITEKMEYNLLGRDLLCALNISISCHSNGLTTDVPQPIRFQGAVFHNAQYWALQCDPFHGSEKINNPHITVAYDPTGKDGDLLAYFKPLIGQVYTAEIYGFVTGPPGSAYLCNTPTALWRQTDGVYLHITASVNPGHSAKELGHLAYQLQQNHDVPISNDDRPLLHPEGTITYFSIAYSVQTTLRHHLSHYRATLPQQDGVNPDVWARDKMTVGHTDVAPIRVQYREDVVLPCIPQYPMKREAKEGIDGLIKAFLQQGVLVPCTSPCNTPILPVPKPGRPGEWRMVQDLRAINKICEPLTPLVPNPATILSSIPASSKVFTCIDLQHAFFSVPLHKDSQFLFAFTFDGLQYTWTRLPQGFVNSPTLFSRTLHLQLSTFTAPGGSALVQYVDDLLLASPDMDSNRQDTIALLNFLQHLGYVVPPTKVKAQQEEVKFLGVLLSANGRTLTKDRIEPIVSLPPPTTPKQMRSFLGLANFCRPWIPNMAVLTKELTPYGSTTAASSFELSQEAMQAFLTLKETLASTPALGRPMYDRDFRLYVTIVDQCASAVLTQKHGDKHRPVAYYSTRMDSVSLGHPPCTQHLTAIYLMVQAAANITLHQHVTVMTSHAVTSLLTSTQTQHMTQARQSRYEILLINNPLISFECCTTINPATFSRAHPEDIRGPLHECLQVDLLATKPRTDLSDTPLPPPAVNMFVDGSSSINEQGRRISGYAITNEQGIVEQAGFVDNVSAQQAELFALTRACILGSGKAVNIYTDSRYAFGVVHDFGHLWKMRGFLTSAGTPILNKIFIDNLLRATLLPTSLAVIKCTAHTTRTTTVDNGNRAAAAAAKNAASHPPMVVHTMTSAKLIAYQVTSSNEALKLPSAADVIGFQRDASDAEKSVWRQYNCTANNQGLWVTPAGQVCLPNALLPTVVDAIHVGTHVGKEVMVRLLLQTWWSPQMGKVAEDVAAGCLVCYEHNVGKSVPHQAGSTPIPTGPFKVLQMDFIELPRCHCYKYVLVIIDVFSRWIEAFPTTNNKATTVVKMLIKEIIPRFGLPEELSSDNGPHFIGKINQELCKALNIKQQFHCPHHPQSAGMVERANGTLKNKLSKLCAETGLNWLQALPLALMHMRMIPQNRLKLTAFEIVFGRPARTPWGAMQIPERPMDLHEMSETMIQYVVQLTKSLQDIHLQVQAAQGSEENEDKNPIEPGDYVMIRNWNRKTLEPRWKGPYQVLLTTSTAVKVEGQEKWTHLSHCKNLKKVSNMTDQIKKDGKKAGDINRTSSSECGYDPFCYLGKELGTLLKSLLIVLLTIYLLIVVAKALIAKLLQCECATRQADNLPHKKTVYMDWADVRRKAITTG